MKGSIRTGLMGLLLTAVAAACGSGPLESKSSTDSPNTGTGGWLATGGTGGGSPSGGAAGNPSPPGPLAECTGIAPSSQVPQLTKAEYDTTIKELLGISGLPNPTGLPPSAYLGPFDGYFNAAEIVAAEVMSGPSRSRFITCDPASAACLDATIRRFGRLAFRRPLTEGEVKKYLGLMDLTPKGTADEVAEGILRALLSAPAFFLLPELGEDEDGGAFKLTSHEIAARLSFLLWDSPPDETLNLAADSDALGSAPQILAQAARMLKSDRATAMITAVHRNYLDGSFALSNPEAPSGPVAAELDPFFVDIVQKGGGFKDLFLSNVAFVSKDTAAPYGLEPARFTNTPMRVELDPSQRPGFITRASLLASLSQDNRSHPIRRGYLVVNTILGLPTGNPDPSFFSLKPNAANATTVRKQFEALTSPQPCATCHTYINPPGFVLERYGGTGAWQDVDPLGGRIDGTANVKFSATETKTITTPLALMTELSQSPAARHVYAERFVTFATGRGSSEADGCIVNQLETSLGRPGYSLATMILDFTQTNAFRLRTMAN